MAYWKIPYLEFDDISHKNHHLHGKEPSWMSLAIFGQNREILRTAFPVDTFLFFRGSLYLVYILVLYINGI